jgi:hypothetical protein
MKSPALLNRFGISSFRTRRFDEGGSAEGSVHPLQNANGLLAWVTSQRTAWIRQEGKEAHSKAFSVSCFDGTCFRRSAADMPKRLLTRMTMHEFGGGRPDEGRGGATWPIFSISGTWIAFVTSDNLVWRPDSTLWGHRIHDDVFTLEGSYVGTIAAGIFTRLEDRAETRIPRAEAPIRFPGYPGLPEPSLVRLLQPGETLESKLVFG